MNSIVGIEKVLQHLKNHKDAYVIIGGIATKLILEKKGFPSRETKDFDIVLLADATKDEFAKDIVFLLKEGKYRKGHSNGKDACYRFVEPQTSGYPKIIELFAVDNNKNLEHYLEKIPIVDEEEELSAIVIDEDVYKFINERKIMTEDDLPIVDELGLIALKSYAYFQNLNLYNDKKIKDKNNYLKHRNDVIRLLASMNGHETPIDLPKILKDECYKFINVLSVSKNIVKQVTNSKISLRVLIETYKHLLSL